MGDMTEPKPPELPTSRFLTTYREVEQELWNQTGRAVYGDPELEPLAQAITMDRCIDAAVREHLQRGEDGVPWLG